MLKPKQIRFAKLIETNIREMKYVFHKPKNWFLSKLWDFLYEKKFITSEFIKEDVVQYHSINLTNDDEKEIIDSIKQFVEFGHHMSDLIVIIGREKFMNLLDYSHSLQSNLNLHRYENGYRTIFNIPVIVVGYIDGILIINKNDLKGI